MQGIYLTALLTIGIAAAIFVPLIHRLRMPANERLVWLAAVLALPMQPLVFYLVRVPLDHWLVTRLGSASTTYQLMVDRILRDFQSGLDRVVAARRGWGATSDSRRLFSCLVFRHRHGRQRHLASAPLPGHAQLFSGPFYLAVCRNHRRDPAFPSLEGHRCGSRSELGDLRSAGLRIIFRERPGSSPAMENRRRR
jgi:hypothetical protein